MWRQKKLDELSKGDIGLNSVFQKSNCHKKEKKKKTNERTKKKKKKKKRETKLNSKRNKIEFFVQLLGNVSEYIAWKPGFEIDKFQTSL